MTDTKKVLIFKGGWDGHEPDLIAERFAGIMEKNGYSCVIYDNQEVMLDLELVMRCGMAIYDRWPVGKPSRRRWNFL